MADHDDHDHEFEKGGSGASQCYPMQCSALRKNGHVLIKGHPCKIVEMSTSKTGKHGHAKVHIVGLDIFSGAKYEENSPSTHNVEVPNVKRTEYMVVDCDDDCYLTLMDENGETRQDIKLDVEKMESKDKNIPKTAQEIKDELDKNMEITAQVVCSMSQEAIKDIRIKDPNKDKK